VVAIEVSSYDEGVGSIQEVFDIFGLAVGFRDVD
jgi:hypothetical protein